MPDYKYNVAFSCHQDDEPVARQLYDLLDGRVGPMFLYTQSQKVLIGEDGVEAFSQTYSTHSRIVVVVYRKEWGETLWTRIEDLAIRDLFLRANVGRVFVYSTDGGAPSWMPKSFIWGSDRSGGLVTCAAAIEQKVQEAGGEIGEEDVVAMADRVSQQLAAAEARERRRFSTEAVHSADLEIAAVNTRLQELAVSVEQKQPGLVRTERSRELLTVFTKDASIVFVWRGAAGNSIQGATLSLCQGYGPPSQYREGGKPREVERFELHLAEDDTTWQWVNRAEQRYSSVQLAENAFRRLLKEHASRGAAELNRRRRG